VPEQLEYRRTSTITCAMLGASGCSLAVSEGLLVQHRGTDVASLGGCVAGLANAKTVDIRAEGDAVKVRSSGSSESNSSSGESTNDSNSSSDSSSSSSRRRRRMGVQVPAQPEQFHLHHHILAGQGCAREAPQTHLASQQQL
jgi:hypothetical protein